MSSAGIQIKVCGMRDPLNLEQLCTLSPDYVGFIFYPGSSRYVGQRPDPALFRIPGPAIKKVGVFVDEKLSFVQRAVGQFGLDAVQLHGIESVEYCMQLSMDKVRVIKVLDPRNRDRELETYSRVTDFFLFDSAGAGSGGSGEKFDWKLLEDLPSHFPFILSGGIGPEDAGPIRALKLRGLAAVDLNSRFELSPGLKNIKLLHEFFKEIRK